MLLNLEPADIYPRIEDYEIIHNFHPTVHDYPLFCWQTVTHLYVDNEEKLTTTL